MGTWQPFFAGGIDCCGHGKMGRKTKKKGKHTKLFLVQTVGVNKIKS
jgi:hypothetical protein